jgi:hypothetical protein
MSKKSISKKSISKNFKDRARLKWLEITNNGSASKFTDNIKDDLRIDCVKRENEKSMKPHRWTVISRQPKKHLATWHCPVCDSVIQVTGHQSPSITDLERFKLHYDCNLQIVSDLQNG